MRDLVVHAWTSLDGYSCDEGTEMFRVMGDTDDPVGDDLFVRRLAGAGTHIMGRVTYLEMADFWPNSSGVNAAPMNEIPKVVFSKSLTSADWGETTIATGDLADAVSHLKQERSGGYLLAQGGVRFARSLGQTGLIDEYRLVVHPVILGAGERLFTMPLTIEPVSTTAFSRGAVAHVFAAHP